MSQNGSTRNSNSLSESSGSSPSQAFMMRDYGDFTDLTLYGSPAPVLSRTGTVRRACKKVEKESSVNGDEEQQNKSPRTSPDLHPERERYRRSLDSTYRLSLESISEYKPKSCFSSSTIYPSRECSSMESSSSDCTDYAILGTTSDSKEDKTLMSPGSSYLTWIESVNSEYFASTTATATEVQDVDSKVGEWNNFWLNYNSPRNRYTSSPYMSTSNEDPTIDEFSDAKSTCSTHREFTEKTATDQVMLTMDEINEVIRCSERITEILQNGLKRTEDVDDNSKESFYSQPYSLQNSVRRLTQFFTSRDEMIPPRERSHSYAMDPQEMQKQKQQLKLTPQSSSSSCINALLTTGVADIFKRVITKRRDILISQGEMTGTPKTSFSEWSNNK